MGDGTICKECRGQVPFQEGRKRRECEEGRSSIVTFYSWSVSARLCKLNFLVVSSKDWISGKTKLLVIIRRQVGVCEYAGWRNTQTLYNILYK